MYRTVTVAELMGLNTEIQGGKENLVTFPPKEEIVTNLSNICDKGVELCITYIPQLQQAFTPATLTSLVRQILSKYKAKDKSLQVILIGEYSKVGVYHMHGAIKAEARTIHLVKRQLQQKIGRTEIKQIKYVSSYITYVLKKDDIDRINQKDIISEELIYII